MRRTVLAVALLARLASASGVESIGMTVSDLDRSVDFYTKVLTFEKVSEFEAEGDAYEHLNGIFGLHIRQARLRLGDEFLELTEYLAPQGRPAPPDARSNDRWFQHVAILVSDMDRAYRVLREHKVKHASPSPQPCPTGTRTPVASRPSIFAIPTGIHWRSSRSRTTKATRSGISPQTSSFWE